MAENDTNQGTGSPAPTGFSREYVEQLRSENADWRKKYQTERERNQVQGIGAELTKRGITAEASWVERLEGQTDAQAVDTFLVKYPHLKPAPATDAQGAVTPDVTVAVGAGGPAVGPVKAMPKPDGTVGDTGQGTTRVTAPTEAIRELNEVKNDPKARAAVAAHYRAMLRANGCNTAPEDVATGAAAK